MYPTLWARHPASFERERRAISRPAMTSEPSVGLSMPAIRFNSVVLPLPLGPMRARNVPCSTSRSSPSSGRITFSPRRYSRVRLRHSMNAIVASFAGAGLTEDANAAPGTEMGRRIGDEPVAREQAGGDLDPAVPVLIPECYLSQGRR